MSCTATATATTATTTDVSSLDDTGEAPPPPPPTNDAPLDDAPRGGGRHRRPSHKSVDFGSMTKKQLRHRLMLKGGVMADLHALAGDMRVRGHEALRKPELVDRVVDKATAGNGFLDRLKRLSA